MIPQVNEALSSSCGQDNWISCLIDSECEDSNLIAEYMCRQPQILLLTDSWSGQSSNRLKLESRLHGARPLTIPPHTTDSLQPLDVGFFRQLKIFIHRITEEALVQNRVGEITSREGTINLMSIIYNQLQSPAYHDLWRYAWHSTDPLFSDNKLATNPHAIVNSIQSGFDPSASCHVDNCTEEVVVRSSHDGHPFCLTHFLQRRSFHDFDDADDAISLDFEFQPGEDEAIFIRSDLAPNIHPTTTSSTPNPVLEAYSNECECEF